MLRSVARVSVPVIAAVLFVLYAVLLLDTSTLGTTLARPSEPGLTSLTTATASFTIALQLITGGLTDPTSMTHAGDGSGRLFVLEQAGQVRVIKNGILLSTPFLNISSQVSCCAERGLLGIAFDPNYASNGTFYLDYTDLSGNTMIVRYVVSSPAADVAHVTSVTTILHIDQPEANHNGGQLQFGPDNYLYIGMGDGGGGDLHGTIGNGQDPSQLLGKILRINVRGVPTYTIPATNPYTQTAGYRPEISALGMRNPWRFSFDRANGDLYIGDVGQDCWEEIEYQPASSHGGENYGWRLMEGMHYFDPNNQTNCNQPVVPPTTYPTLTRPVYNYDHNSGCSVTGGYVYRGNDYPQMSGVYFFGDFCSSRVWSMERTNPDTWIVTDKLGVPGGISSFGEDQNAELYVLSYNGGSVYKIISAAGTPQPDLSSSTKSASKATAQYGDVIGYSIVLRNTGAPLTTTTRVTDTVPGGLVYIPGSLTASLGLVNASAAPTLKWSGLLSNAPVVTITYGVTVSSGATQAITNFAMIAPGYTAPFTRSAAIVVNGWTVYLPLTLKN